jgi:hypothetical protein
LRIASAITEILESRRPLELMAARAVYLVKKCTIIFITSMKALVARSRIDIKRGPHPPLQRLGHGAHKRRADIFKTDGAAPLRGRIV